MTSFFDLLLSKIGSVMSFAISNSKKLSKCYDHSQFSENAYFMLWHTNFKKSVKSRHGFDLTNLLKSYVQRSVIKKCRGNFNFRNLFQIQMGKKQLLLRLKIIIKLCGVFLRKKKLLFLKHIIILKIPHRIYKIKNQAYFSHRIFGIVLDFSIKTLGLQCPP